MFDSDFEPEDDDEDDEVYEDLSAVGTADLSVVGKHTGLSNDMGTVAVKTELTVRDLIDTVPAITSEDGVVMRFDSIRNCVIFYGENGDEIITVSLEI
jgi:hypothetical protein